MSLLYKEAAGVRPFGPEYQPYVNESPHREITTSLLVRSIVTVNSNLLPHGKALPVRTR